MGKGLFQTFNLIFQFQFLSLERSKALSVGGGAKRFFANGLFERLMPMVEFANASFKRQGTPPLQTTRPVNTSLSFLSGQSGVIASATSPG